jgi:catechol 2,3-dioxygenase-like lactoylglutathione lyase family enzyme
MIFNHVSVHVRDLDKSRAFYDPLLKVIGLSRYEEGKHADACAYGTPECTFWVRAPGAYGVGSGHICFNAASKAEVEEFFRTGAALGGEGLGKPASYAAGGLQHYTAMVADPDGNRVEAVCVLGPA